MSWMWLEAALPLGIIAGMLCVMGNAQYYIHKAAHGWPKHIGDDMWDVAMERRDKKLMGNLAAPSPNYFFLYGSFLDNFWRRNKMFI